MSYVQLLGWHDYFVPPSLQIFSEGCYFIFNCGENSQRFRLSNKLGLAKIRYLFLTNLSAHSFFGLPSLILSLDGCNTTHLTVFGPKPLKEVLTNLLKTFLELKIEVTVVEIHSDEATELVKCNSLTIYGFTYESKINSTFTLECVHNKNVGYLVQYDRVQGTFKPELAQQFGVQKGPDFGKLKKGLDITLDDGAVLKSDQVCGEPVEGKQILILDGPHDYKSVKELKIDDKLLSYRFYLHANPTGISSSEVTCNRTLEDHKYVGFPPYYYRNHIHHSIFPSLFPNLSHIPLERVITKSIEELFCVTFDEIKAQILGTGLNYHPLTKFFVHPPKKMTVDIADCLTKEMDAPAEKFETIDYEVDLNGPKITFLGTGCSVPSVYRNVSSTLVQLYDDYSILLDAGEGTVLQILYTCDDFDSFIKKLLSIRIIFISHSHADHHLGLYHVLALQTKFRKDNSKTLVVCSDVIMTWLKTYNDHICKLNYEPMVLTEDLDTTLLLDKSTLKLSFFKVEHIFDSFGIKIAHDIATIVYSGDTRPCESLIKHARNADILIHESTFTDEYYENAVRNMHTTISEAIQIALKCNVKNLFVTHFSQRFQSIPNDYDVNLNLVMASDLMTVPIGALDKVVPHLKKFNKIVKDVVK